MYDAYSVVDVRNRDVVDVGAFVGDTAVYFIKRGAHKVLAIEPHPRAFNELIRNIRINGLQGRVVPINAALGGRQGFIYVPEDLDVGNIMSTYFGYEYARYVPGYVKVRVMALGELVKEYEFNPDVLKMNCEGCEYDVILNDYGHVRLFNELIFEYHRWITGIPVDAILSILSKDYYCEPIGLATEDYGYVHCSKTT
jgi:FkbM family methyltransferase